LPEGKRTFWPPRGERPFSELIKNTKKSLQTERESCKSVANRSGEEELNRGVTHREEAMPGRAAGGREERPSGEKGSLLSFGGEGSEEPLRRRQESMVLWKIFTKKGKKGTPQEEREA